MIIEWHEIKISLMVAFIVVYGYRKWIGFNTCKVYEIERLKIKGEM